jgi:hypothetical protein
VKLVISSHARICTGAVGEYGETATDLAEEVIKIELGSVSMNTLTYMILPVGALIGKHDVAQLNLVLLTEWCQSGLTGCVVTPRVARAVR